MNNSSEKSKAFSRFEHYFFEIEIPPNANIFQHIDMWTIDKLNPEEKIIAENMLIDAIKTRIEPRLLYGLEEIKTERAYNILLELFLNENNLENKLRLAYSLVRINNKAPVLQLLDETIRSTESEKIKLSALYPIFWIREIVFSDHQISELILTILFNAMSDEHLNVRLYAYDILQDYFKMKDYTSIYDEIKQQLTEENELQYYKKTVQLYKEKITSKKELPFSRDKIVQFINEKFTRTPIIPVQQCKICKEIPEKVEADIAAGESIERYSSKLEKIIIIAYYKNCIKQCPICKRLYSYSYHYEYLITNSEEEEYLSRIDHHQALQMIDNYLDMGFKFDKIIICEPFLKIDY
ncbi:MAG: hypothetical protein ACFFDW_00755 [Candidatus Thorarchaeota archaeon]